MLAASIGLLINVELLPAQVIPDVGVGNTVVNGILIDADGVVKPQFRRSKHAKLDKKRREAEAAKTLSAEVNTASPLRKVSLVQLEAACEECVQNGKPIPEEVAYLAGLQRIDYLFVYPDKQDLVIAGPAEGFLYDESGRAVGVSTGRPPLRLDDLLVALRRMQSGGDLGCSIDPVQERLAALTRYVANNSTPAPSSVAKARYRRMARILGMHDVRIWGVPPGSHFARTLLEADYRMKLISVGLEPSGVRGLKSHLSMLRPGGNSMQRWWFTPLYDAFTVSEDGNAFQFAGQRAQLLSQNEVVSNSGRRADAHVTRATTQRFSRAFTQKFPELANTSPVFAELQNLIDLAVLAALLKKESLPQKVGWEMALFLDAVRAPIATGTVPSQVPAVANFRESGSRLILGLVGGGVKIDPQRTLARVDFRKDTTDVIKGLRTESFGRARPKAHAWWWD
jgi:hypothetical protein